MRLRGALWGWAAITAIYIGVLVAVDRGRFAVSDLAGLGEILAVLMALVLLSFVIRFARWHWLLCRRGHRVPLVVGFAAYLSGLAFTASPGKVGELVRIRYYARLGVQADTVVSSFIFERLMDLLTLGLISAPIALTAPGYSAGLLLIAVVFAFVFILSHVGGIALAVVSWLGRRGHIRAGAAVEALGRGLIETRLLLRPTPIAVALVYGLVAWGLQSCGFLLVLQHLDVSVPVVDAAAILPAAMLIGAASMLPGGIGATEAAVIVLLATYAVPVDIGTTVAVVIRIATLWFAILVGMIAITVLEARDCKSD
ncbi:MAG: lysylphosphatidylglycerol synthase transmembrane domain-containing protein [Ancalomicrobiaceae bacterium]|nr:lysylphosphatidylglycerol synthase transmembrane domain-containing protein [Ancalomicrobiaceae bacterium]